jgi:hypothetical protein
MRVKEQVKVYIADDGKEFATREECKAYEDKDVFKPLLRLTADQLNAILTGEDEVKGKLIHKLWVRHVEALRKLGVKPAKVKRSKEEKAALRLAKAKEVLEAAAAEQSAPASEVSEASA